jgi:hypothetical protein
VLVVKKYDISEDVAIVAVHISDAAWYPYICHYICKSFIQLKLSKLGIDPTNITYVTNYNKMSAFVMENIDRMKSGKEPQPIRIHGLENKTMNELLNDVGILFRDGYNEHDSNFQHEDRPSPPIYESTIIGIGGHRKRESVINKEGVKKVEGRGDLKGGGGSMGGGKQLAVAFGKANIKEHGVSLLLEEWNQVEEEQPLQRVWIRIFQLRLKFMSFLFVGLRLDAWCHPISRYD